LPVFFHFFSLLLNEQLSSFFHALLFFPPRPPDPLHKFRSRSGPPPFPPNVQREKSRYVFLLASLLSGEAVPPFFLPCSRVKKKMFLVSFPLESTLSSNGT